MCILTYDRDDAIATAREIGGYWFSLGACFVAVYAA